MKLWHHFGGLVMRFLLRAGNGLFLLSIHVYVYWLSQLKCQFEIVLWTSTLAFIIFKIYIYICSVFQYFSYIEHWKNKL